MTEILLIARRDLQAYYNTAWGYVVTAAILLVNGLLFNAFALSSKARYSGDVLEDFFYFSAGSTMIAAILLTMRLFAEERSQGTIVLLDTAPVTDLQVVLGKFLAAWGMMFVLTTLTIYMPALIFVNGKVSIGHVLGGYLGLMCLASAVVSVGTWASSLARSQWVALAISSLTVILLLLMWLLGRITDPPINGILSYMALFDKHFQPFMKGRINSQSLIYYASLTFAFLFLAVRGLQGRRWR